MGKYSSYPEKTAPSNNDVFAIEDSAASGASKRITRGNFIAGSPLPANTIDAQAIQDDAITAPKLSGLDRANLTTDSNPYKFSAFLSSPQSPSNSTKLELKGELYDTNNNFDSTTNYRYVAPVTGFYHFNGALKQLLSNGGQTQVTIYKNGSIAAYGPLIFNNSGGNQSMTSAVGIDLQLTAGDTVELYSGAVSTSAAFTTASETFLTGHLISRT